MAKRLKPRNWTAVHAHFRTGAGNHGDAQKADSRARCRGRINFDDIDEIEYEEDYLKEDEQEACKSGSLVVE